uniref:Caveolae associated protein 1b n=1 Tax=Paramormyrops kingsleyae TaxID=1676925 RepID=A0A3B3R589_9TELE
MADSTLQLEEADEVAEAAKELEKDDSQMNGMMVLALLDKIIGAVDKIQQTQTGLETRQREMDQSVTGIQSELAKLSKSHTTTANTVNKMLEKVRKVSVNVKSVRTNLEKQAGQIKRLESNENELLKRRNFKVMIYQDDMKMPSRLSISKSMKVADSVEGEAESGLKEVAEETEEDGEKANPNLSSDEEVEIEEIIEESRAERIKRSSLQRVDNIKKVFSKEKMEKTRQKTKENLEKTKTRENLEKTRQNIEKKMGKLSTRMSVNTERKEKLKSSRDKMKKSFTPDHTVYARSKTAVYKVPPFTFHVKKIRDGEVEVHGTEMVEVAGEEEEPGESELPFYSDSEP